MGITTIAVVDEAAAGAPTTTVFHCETALLLRHMPRLAADVQDVPGQDTEVCLHCDCATFSWLLAYVKSQQQQQQQQQQQPALDSGNCIALLLASHFLHMRPVVKACIAFTAATLPQLASAAAHQLLALEPGLFARVAHAAEEEVLEALVAQLQEQSGREPDAQLCTLTEKLFKAKLAGLLAQHRTTLLACSACGQMFSAAAHQKLRCPAAGAGGVAVARDHQGLTLHQADSSWKLAAFLKRQRHSERPQSWRQLYWRAWGHAVVLYCERCWVHFPAVQHAWCCYHPSPAAFASDTAPGQHPCCGEPAWRPGLPSSLHQGCCRRPHECGGSSVETARALQLLVRYAPMLEQQQQHSSSSSSNVGSESPAAPGQTVAVPLLMRLAQRSRLVQSPPPPAAISGGRCSSNGDSSSVSRASDAADGAASSPQQPDGEPDEGSLCSQLGSLLCAARSACGRGGGFAAAAAGNRGSSAVAAAAAAARRQQQAAEVAAPLADTFSAAGKRGLVLQAARHASAATAGTVKLSTAAEPGAPTRMTRTRLLELVRQDEEARLDLLMRRLDAMRLQPRPDAARTVEGDGQAARKKRKPGRKAPGKP